MKQVVTILVTWWLVMFVAEDLPAGEIEFVFTNSYDRSEQKAAGFVPDNVEGRMPLLAVAHYWGGSRFTAKKQGYYKEGGTRGWIIVCPELHGQRTSGQTSLAATQAQHDMSDAIDHMANRYPVDMSRIYLAGRSMGGMLAQIMAAKYPDRFAAVVAGQGIADLHQWILDRPSFRPDIEKECGPYTEETRFDYERRSSLNYAANFQHVPLLLWHGTNDRVVPTSNSARLYNAVRKHYIYQQPVFWLHGAAHNPHNYPPSWVCDQVALYQIRSDERVNAIMRFYPCLDLITDESKSFFWLTVRQRDTNTFSRIDAKLRQQLLHVSAENIELLTINLDHIPAEYYPQNSLPRGS